MPGGYASAYAMAYVLLRDSRMKVADCPDKPALQNNGQQVLRLPLGLLGFEDTKDYVLVSNSGEEPFLWMQVVDNPSLAFLVLSPFTVFPDYRPDIMPEDTQFLQIGSPDDALILNVVTMRGANHATLNLKGPIVLNRHTLVGKQVIPANAADYSVQHPLPA